MDSLLLLIPISLILVAVIVWALMWSIKSGQFEDLEGPAHQIIMDDDDIKPESESATGSDAATSIKHEKSV